LIDASSPSFSLAKQQVIHGLEKFIRFSNDMDIKFPEFGFRPFTDKLRNLGNTIRSASGPCFSAAEIEEIENFSNHLSSNQDYINHYFVHQGFLPKLQIFWKLRQAIISTGEVTKIILWRLSEQDIFRNDLNKVNYSIKRAFEVTKTTNYIIEAILSNRALNFLLLTSILLAFIIRVEAHEYEIEHIITNANKYTNMNYDIQEMLSVSSKVQKGWKSDTRAIRDAISHAHFTIREVKKDYIIHFKNTEQGYNFDKAFTKIDMPLFYQDYDRLIIIQTLLLNSALVTDFMTRELKI
jgi:hypothetical protein